MAHDVIGLDLGSHQVRAVVLRMTLRKTEVVRVESEPVALDENGRSTWIQILEAAGRLKQRLQITHETVHCALPGELVSIRRLELPSSASKRLEQVLKFELDEILPFDIEDAVFDFVEISHTSDEIAVLTTTALKEKAKELIEGLDEYSVAPREIGVAALAYVSALTRDKSFVSEESAAAVVDIGHERTNIAILDKNFPTIRTLLRGGRTLTEKLAKVGGAEFEKAEAFKRQYGLEGKVGEVLKTALRPLVREIQQTFKGHLATGGSRVDRVLLAGGGSLLKGLEEYLSGEIGIPVDRYNPPVGEESELLHWDKSLDFTLAYCLAHREEIPRARRIDLRRGELAFKGDYEFLKKRIGWIAACLLAVIFSWIFASWAEYSSLADRTETLKSALTEKTNRLFGSPVLKYDQIKERIGEEKMEAAPIPAKDAFDIVVELSKRIPENVVHDVDMLEIKPKRITLRGIVDADLKTESDTDSTNEAQADAGTDLSPTDLIKQRLEEFRECFAAIRVGKVTAIGERRRYQMDIDSRCP